MAEKLTFEQLVKQTLGCNTHKFSYHFCSFFKQAVTELVKEKELAQERISSVQSVSR